MCILQGIPSCLKNSNSAKFAINLPLHHHLYLLFSCVEKQLTFLCKIRLNMPNYKNNCFAFCSIQNKQQGSSGGWDDDVAKQEWMLWLPSIERTAKLECLLLLWLISCWLKTELGPADEAFNRWSSRYSEQPQDERGRLPIFEDIYSKECTQQFSENWNRRVESCSRVN